VQLSGFVDTPEHAVKAGRVARNVEGVRAIKNDLLVK
jgi:osmotically-inducible protein OsmY